MFALTSIVLLASSSALLVGAQVSPQRHLRQAFSTPLGSQDQLTCQATSHEEADRNLQQNYYNKRNETSCAERSDASFAARRPNEFNIDSTNWRWLYLDEMLPPNYEILVKERSIDERLANVLYTVGTDRVSNGDAFKFNSGDKEQDEENERLAAGPEVDDEKCGVHLRQLLGDIEELSAMLDYSRTNKSYESFDLEERHVRLARLLDSFGHYESGYLSGRLFSMGSYKQCIKTKLMLEPKRPEELTGSRFCWARLSFEKHLNPILKARQKSAFDLQSNVISTGICIPETCHTKSFSKHRQLFQKLVDGQFKLPKSVYVNENLELESIFCVVDERSQLSIPFNGKLLLGLIATCIGLAVFVTFNREKVESIKNKSIRLSLECLDLKTNWNWFVGSNEMSRTSRIDLDAVNPIKWFGCTFVVFGHSIITRATLSIDYLEGLQSAEESSIGLVLLGTNVVDTFFVLSGILMAYLVLKKSGQQQKQAKLETSEQQEENKLPLCENGLTSRKAIGILRFAAKFFKAVMKVMLTRYLRLVPLFALAFWFKKSVFMYIGSGPFWDYGFNRETAHGACKQESWLTPFTYNSALQPLTKQCLLQSWSVSSDIYFTLIFAPILVIMTKFPKFAATLSTILCVASTWGMAKAVLNIDPVDGDQVRDLRIFGMSMLVNKFSYIYTTPHFRMASFAIGALAGYALHKYEVEKSLEEGWPAWFKGGATRVAFFTLFLAIYVFAGFGLRIRNYMRPNHRHLFLFFMTGFKILWCLSQAVIFLRMMTDWKDTATVKIFSNRFWSAMAKVSYLMLMFHYDLLTFNASEQQTYVTNDWSHIFTSFASVYMMCFPLAVLGAVLFERPKDRLIKIHLF